MEEKKIKFIGFKVTKDEDMFLEKVKEITGLSKSAIIRHIIRKFRKTEVDPFIRFDRGNDREGEE